MANVFCSNCGASVDASDDRCPHCGHAMSERIKEKPTPLVITCPQCGKEYGRDFSSCPHCGHHIEGHIAKSVPSPISTKSSSLSGIAALALVFAIIVLFFTFSTSNSSPKESDIGGIHSSNVARSIVRLYIEEHMHNPSSAKFGNLNAEYLDHNEYKVTGWVEGTNLFGATVRQNFTATYTATGAESASNIYILYH